MRYYSLTIDKVDYSVDSNLPTEASLTKVFVELCRKCKFTHVSRFPVYSFEYKAHTADIKRLHMHAMVESRYYLKYSSVKQSGYSIKCELLKSHKDVARWAGYVVKKKVDGYIHDGIKNL